MGSKKTKTTNDPWAPAQPYILKGMQATDEVFDRNQPRLQGMSDDLYSAAKTMAPGAFGATPFVNNAQGVAQAISNGSFLGNNPGQQTYDRLQNGGNNPASAVASKVAKGGYLNAQPSAGLYAGMMGQSYSTSNPYLDDMIRQTGADVRTNTNRMFAARGMGSGVSSAFADVMSKNLADSGNALRYQNYNEAENRRLQAAGQSDAAWGGERGRMDAASGQLASNYNAQQDRALEAARSSDAARSDQVQQMLTALGMTGDLRNAEYTGVAPTLSVLNGAADLPYVGVGALNGNIRTASNGYGVQTTKESGGLGGVLGSMAGSFASNLAGGLGGSVANKIYKK